MAKIVILSTTKSTKHKPQKCIEQMIIRKFNVSLPHKTNDEINKET